MLEEAIVEEVQPEVAKLPKVKSKRDIFRFEGEKPSAINLEHVTQVTMEGVRITFQFYNTAMYVDLENEEAAKSIFEIVLNVWAGEVK